MAGPRTKRKRSPGMDLPLDKQDPVKKPSINPEDAAITSAILANAGNDDDNTTEQSASNNNNNNVYSSDGNDNDDTENRNNTPRKWPINSNAASLDSTIPSTTEAAAAAAAATISREDNGDSLSAKRGDTSGEGNDHADVRNNSLNQRQDRIRTSADEDQRNTSLPQGGDNNNNNNNNSNNKTTSNNNNTQHINVLGASPAAEKAVRSSTPVSNMSKNTEHRKTRILRALQYRKELLSQVKRGRKASQTCISNANATPKSGTRAQEIADFQKMTAEVHSIVRKQSRTEMLDVEKRSVSLRRGSSVGKKMTSALASLAPFASSATASALQSDQMDIDETNAQTVAAATTPANVVSAPKSSATVRSAQRPFINKVILPKSLPKAAAADTRDTSITATSSSSNKKKASGSISPRGVPSSSSSNIAPLTYSNALASKQMSRINPIAAQSSLISNVSIADPTTHAHSSYNTAMYQQMPIEQPVVFPLAIALREQRDKLRSKLVEMLQHRDEYKHITASANPESTGLSRNSSRQSEVAESIINSPALCSKLPQRRRTHWDTLLDEMKWLAQDYREERKWKLSTARIVSTLAVESRKVEQLKSSVSDLVETKKEVSVTADDGKDSGTSIDYKDTNSVSIGEKSTHVLTETTEKDEKDTKEAVFAEKKYPRPTLPDGTASLSVSRSIANVMVEQHNSKQEHINNHSVVASSTDESVVVSSNKKHQSVADNASSNTNNEAEVPEALASTAIDVPDSNAVVPPSDDKAGTDEDEAKVEKEDQMAVDVSASSRPSNPDIESQMAKKIDLIEQVLNKPLLKPVKGKKSANSMLQLSKEQLVVTDRISSYWKNVESGANLSGPRFVGKTTAVCSLLYKHRKDGCQVIFCGRNSVVRWSHEISRWKGLKGIVIDASSSEKGNDNASIYSPENVVICSFDDSDCILMKCNVDNCVTVIVDCRFPMSFYGFGEVLQGTDQREELFRGMPYQLRSSSWWRKLAVFSLKVKQRLIVDAVATSDLSKQLSSLTRRERLNILCYRFVVLLGGDVFGEPEQDIAKLVLLWLRQKTRDKGSTEPRVERVEKLVVKSIEHFRVLLNDEVDTTRWEVRACHMDTTQSRCYNQYCEELVSVLCNDNVPMDGVSLHEEENVVDLCKALLQMRRVCFHAALGSILQRCRSHLAECTVRGTLLYNSACQMNLDLARDILIGSSKLKELVKILMAHMPSRGESGNDSNEILTQIGLSEKPEILRTKRREQSQLKKIAIIAALPEVQLLTSALLSCLGIRHNVISVVSNATVTSKANIAAENGALQMYNRYRASQEALSRFNRSDGDVSSIEVIIASPVSVGTDHCGLCLDGADIVVSLDEDWSGRLELILESVCFRNSFRHEKEKRSRCDFIKLYAANTCEEYFLSELVDFEADKLHALRANPLLQSSYFTTIDEFGILQCSQKNIRNSLKCDLSETLDSDNFCFPAMNILAASNKAFATVFCLPKQGIQAELWEDSQLFLGNTKAAWKPYSELWLVEKLVICEEAVMNVSGGLFCTNSIEYIMHVVLPPTICTPVHDIDEEKSLMTVTTMTNDIVKFKATINPLTQSKVQSHSITESRPLQNGAQSIPYAIPDESGSHCHPSTLSYLLYGKSVLVDVDSSADNDRHAAKVSSTSRTNDFVKNYTKCRGQLSFPDNSTTTEGLVYFPPLFPHLHQAYLHTTSEENRYKAELSEDMAIMTSGTKRNLPQVEGSSAKRPHVSVDEDIAAVTATTEDEVDDMEAVLKLDLSEYDSVGDLPLLNEEDLMESNEVVVPSLPVEDFGLIGSGLMSLPNSDLSHSSSALQVVSCSTHASVDGLNSWILHGDSRRYETMDSSSTKASAILLLTSRKRTRDMTNLPIASGPGSFAMLPPTSQYVPSAAITVASSAVVHTVNNGKQLKNAVMEYRDKATLPTMSHQNPSLLYTNGPDQANSALPPTNVDVVKAKELFKRRLLRLSRKSGYGTTLFELPTFRSACVVVRARVMNAMLCQNWNNGAYSEYWTGLRLQSNDIKNFAAMANRNQSSLVRPLSSENVSTGTDAIATGQSTTLAFRSSSFVPQRVDFGPFQCGFFGNTSGVFAVAMNKVRTGVSLPMGVKIPLLTNISQVSWSEVEDKKLTAFVRKFGSNWTLCACMLMATSSHQSNRSNNEAIPLRSARSCRERWRQLSQESPSVFSDLAATQSEHEGCASVRVSEIVHSTVETVTLTSDKHDNDIYTTLTKSATLLRRDNRTTVANASESVQTVSSPFQMLQSSPSLSRLRELKKSRRMAATLPGVVAGPPNIIPSHSTHMQAVQESVAAGWPGRRTDMWPLSLLEIIDQQRAAKSPPVTSTAQLSPTTPSVSMRSVSSTTGGPALQQVAITNTPVYNNNNGNATLSSTSLTHGHHIHHSNGTPTNQDILGTTSPSRSIRSTTNTLKPADNAGGNTVTLGTAAVPTSDPTASDVTEAKSRER